MTQNLLYTNKYVLMLRRELNEYETMVSDITVDERKEVREWVASGNSPYINPFLMCGEDGRIMDYIAATRIVKDMADNPEDYTLVAPQWLSGNPDPNDALQY